VEWVKPPFDLLLIFEKTSLKKKSWANLIFCLFRIWFLLSELPAKIKLEVDKQTGSSNLIFQTRFFKNQVQINRGKVHSKLHTPLNVIGSFYVKTFPWVYLLQTLFFLYKKKVDPIKLSIVCISKSECTKLKNENTYQIIPCYLENHVSKGLPVQL
jgi:hypothetical protein